MGSFLYRLNVPFIFGPAGGGQHAPEAFKQYFLDFWQSELQRKKVSDLMVKYNPACKNMVENAHAVLVSNPDTMALAKSIGARNCHFSSVRERVGLFACDHPLFAQLGSQDGAAQNGVTH